MSYNSKYKGKQVEDSLDKVQELNVAAIEMGTEVDDVVLEYATTQYVDDAITEAIIITLNTEV